MGMFCSGRVWETRVDQGKCLNCIYDKVQQDPWKGMRKALEQGNLAFGLGTSDQGAGLPSILLVVVVILFKYNEKRTLIKQKMENYILLNFAVRDVYQICLHISIQYHFLSQDVSVFLKKKYNFSVVSIIECSCVKMGKDFLGGKMLN